MVISRINVLFFDFYFFFPVKTLSKKKLREMGIIMCKNGKYMTKNFINGFCKFGSCSV
jgi:hypothetical protein